MKYLVLLLLLALTPLALANDEGGKRGGRSHHNASTDVDVANFADNYLTNDISGGAVTANPSMNNTTKTYAISMSDLTTSQSKCPLLGSVSILIVAFTYEVERCAAWRDIELMESIGMTKSAAPEPFKIPLWSRACQVESIAEIHPWCVGKVVKH